MTWQEKRLQQHCHMRAGRGRLVVVPVYLCTRCVEYLGRPDDNSIVLIIEQACAQNLGTLCVFVAVFSCVVCWDRFLCSMKQ